MTPAVQTRLLAILLFTAALISGCCCRRTEQVYPVTGQVLLEGQPLADATVVLHPADGKGRSFTARTDATGRFKLTTYAPGDGAPAGSYMVTVEYRQLVQEGDELVHNGPNLLPARYAQGTTSGIRCEVKAGANELPAWDLLRR